MVARGRSSNAAEGSAAHGCHLAEDVDGRRSVKRKGPRERVLRSFAALWRPRADAEKLECGRALLLRVLNLSIYQSTIL